MQGVTPVPIPNTEVKPLQPMILLSGKVGYRRLYGPLQVLPGEAHFIFPTSSSCVFHLTRSAGSGTELSLRMPKQSCYRGRAVLEAGQLGTTSPYSDCTTSSTPLTCTRGDKLAVCQIGEVHAVRWIETNPRVG
jgi:hypothetical protein